MKIIDHVQARELPLSRRARTKLLRLTFGSAEAAAWNAALAALGDPVGEPCPSEPGCLSALAAHHRVVVSTGMPTTGEICSAGRAPRPARAMPSEPPRIRDRVRPRPPRPPRGGSAPRHRGGFGLHRGDTVGADRPRARQRHRPARPRGMRQHRGALPPCVGASRPGRVRPLALAPRPPGQTELLKPRNAIPTHARCRVGRAGHKPVLVRCGSGPGGIPGPSPRAGAVRRRVASVAPVAGRWRPPCAWPDH